MTRPFVEGEAGLEHIDEVLGLAGFVFADAALQEFLRPEGVVPASFCEPSMAIGWQWLIK
jgi:hypothetical protein